MRLFPFQTINSNEKTEYHLTPQDQIRHMNIQFYQKGVEGRFKQTIVPGTSTDNYHKFLDFKY